MLDNKVRSVLKALSYRLSASVVIGVVAFLYTKRIEISLIAFVGDFIVKLFLYYFHERIWEKIKFGKN